MILCLCFYFFVFFCVFTTCSGASPVFVQCFLCAFDTLNNKDCWRLLIVERERRNTAFY